MAAPFPVRQYQARPAVGRRGVDQVKKLETRPAVGLRAATLGTRHYHAHLWKQPPVSTAAPRIGVIPTRTSPTTLQIPETLVTGTDALWMNLLRLRRVASAPGANEYTISGQLVTLGFVLDVTDYIDVDYLGGPLLFRPRCQTPVTIDGPN